MHVWRYIGITLLTCIALFSALRFSSCVYIRYKQNNVVYEVKLDSKGIILTMKKCNLSHCYFHNYQDKLPLFALARTDIRYWKESPSHPPLRHCFPRDNGVRVVGGCLYITAHLSRLWSCCVACKPKLYSNSHHFALVQGILSSSHKMTKGS